MAKEIVHAQLREEEYRGFCFHSKCFLSFLLYSNVKVCVGKSIVMFP